HDGSGHDHSHGSPGHDHGNSVASHDEQHRGVGHGHDHDHVHGHRHDHDLSPGDVDLARGYEHAHGHAHDPVHVADEEQMRSSDAAAGTHASPREHVPAGHVHRHGWGRAHTHDVEMLTRARPSLAVLLGLGIAGGLLPDPGALAILLSAIASGRLMLGLATVLVFSVGFASVLVVGGLVAARIGKLVLDWLSSRWVRWVQVGAAVVIVAVGVVLTVNAWRTLSALV